MAFKTCVVCAKEFQVGTAATVCSPECRAERKKARQRAHYRTPEYRQWQREHWRRSPEYRQRKLDRDKAKRRDPGWQDAERVRRKKRCGRPEVVAQMKRSAHARYQRKRADAEWLAVRQKRTVEFKRNDRSFYRLLATLAGVESLSTTLEQKMNDHDATSLEAVRVRAKAMTTEELKSRFAEGLRVTRERFTELGAILVELESRGETVDGDKFLIRFLRKIGLGELRVEAAVRFAGQPYVLRVVQQMPVEEQDRVLAMPDGDVNEYIRSKPKNGGTERKHRRWADKPGERDDEGECRMPDFKTIAGMASPKDVAEMCLELIQNSTDPGLVIATVEAEFSTLKRLYRDGVLASA